MHICSEERKIKNMVIKSIPDSPVFKDAIIDVSAGTIEIFLQCDTDGDTTYIFPLDICMIFEDESICCIEKKASITCGKEFAVLAVFVNPNPANTAIQLDYQIYFNGIDNMSISIQIYNLYGTLVLDAGGYSHNNSSTGTINLDVSNLLSGQYNILFQYGNSFKLLPFIKQ